ncbi:hypothetical protein ACFB49_05070 [Sphingomonas sp. DBB INV C78]|uniref:OmpA family protein n=1 Tax=Sphingomonas sp. DBB INV C78 TaxID=3349434 RepID=UPI0036D37091
MIRASVALGALALLTACATQSVLLLDGENGAKTGAVAVIDEKSGEDRALIDQANTRANVGGSTVRQRAVDPTKLSEQDRALIDGLPPPPRSFTLYFAEDSTDLVSGSDATLNELFAEVARRPGADVLIIGHTDRLGSQEDNDRLSLDRARHIRETLITRGLDPTSTRASGRGERDPLIPTADETREPMNRRVEVLVR